MNYPINLTSVNAGVTKAGQPRANRIPLLYPCYTRSVLPLKREKVRDRSA